MQGCLYLASAVLLCSLKSSWDISQGAEILCKLGVYNACIIKNIRFSSSFSIKLTNTYALQAAPAEALQPAPNGVQDMCKLPHHPHIIHDILCLWTMHKTLIPLNRSQNTIWGAQACRSIVCLPLLTTRSVHRRCSARDNAVLQNVQKGAVMSNYC